MVDRLPCVLGPLFPGELVCLKGTEPLFIASDSLPEVSILVLTANHEITLHNLAPQLLLNRLVRPLWEADANVPAFKV